MRSCPLPKEPEKRKCVACPVHFVPATPADFYCPECRVKYDALVARIGGKRTPRQSAHRVHLLNATIPGAAVETGD